MLVAVVLLMIQYYLQTIVKQQCDLIILPVPSRKINVRERSGKDSEGKA